MTRRIDFISGFRYWAIVPRLGLSPTDRESALPASVAAQQLERWCSDPTTWSRMLELYESVSGARVRALTTVEVDRQVKPTLRRAVDSGAWIVLSGESASYPAFAIPTLQIVLPVSNSVIVMDETPRIPALDLVVTAKSGLSDLTSTTTFDWSAVVRHNPRTAGDRNGPNREFSITATGSAVGGRFSVVFNGVMAGELSIEVRATIDGRPASARTAGFTVVARNPNRSTVQAEIGDDLLRRIACHESGQRQFATTPGTTTRSPLWSGDNLGGVGLFQITVPAPSHDQVWNWRQKCGRRTGSPGARPSSGKQLSASDPWLAHARGDAGLLE
jgi:hypothetical protein